MFGTFAFLQPTTFVFPLSFHTTFSKLDKIGPDMAGNSDRIVSGVLVKIKSSNNRYTTLDELKLWNLDDQIEDNKNKWIIQNKGWRDGEIEDEFIEPLPEVCSILFSP